MSTNRAQRKVERKRRLSNRKRRIQYRLRERHWSDQPRPMFAADNIHYELTERTHGLGPGGIGAMHLLARRSGLIEGIDKRLHLLKIHKPYHESDHVLNIAYNILSGGTCLEDLELWRNDKVDLDAPRRSLIGRVAPSGFPIPPPAATSVGGLGPKSKRRAEQMIE